ncbi:uncharacterized protein LOC127811618 [Diospyros lotus]|uniref:uncharacterized protein LOC127811618 n=1 Tax=Diospyros lotus TaxID=55363 RepID=UPI00224CECD5|nr:uncharacterized protein LOC127811618 [Diospyros lotus]
MEGGYSFRSEEFEEEDVWAVLGDRRGFTNSKVGFSESSSTGSAISRKLPTAVRMIPRVGGGSGVSGEAKEVRQSAPVNVPDWSKIYGKKAGKGSSSSPAPPPWLGGGGGEGSWDSEEDEDEDSDGNVMPPHEWIARKTARSQTTSFSVCEGAGRTLKGRDLSRVRNAVLTRTGFLER